MGLENLLNYTEVDPNTRLAVTSTQVTGAQVNAVASNYLYYDFGAVIDDFTVLFEMYLNGALSTALCSCGIGLTAATIGDMAAWQTNDVAVRMVETAGPVYSIYISEGDFSEQASVTINTATLYYNSLERSAGGTSADLKVYSDAARTVQVGATKSITIAGGTVFRYLYAAANYNSGVAGRDFYGYIQNISIVSSGIDTGSFIICP